MKNFGIDLNEIDVATELENYFNLTSTNITKGFFSGICKVFTKMRYYQEEGTHIKFRIAVGVNSGHSQLPRLYSFQQENLSNDMSREEVDRVVFGIIKKVLPCCRDNNDIYIILDSSLNEVKAGIYFLDLNMMDQIAHDLMNARFFIAECVEENIILINTKDQKAYIKFALEDKNYDERGLLANDCKNKSLSVRYWKGVFEQVKRCCHGTICLVVNNRIDLKDSNFQELFTKPLNEIKDITITPNLFGENGSTESDHAIQIFMSMLNYDGITIIDNLGRIRSYNNICKNGNNPNVQGGSRHIAYEQMKNWNHSDLVGIYFQSQEGEIEFFHFKSKKITNFFNASIMNYVDETTFNSASKAFRKIQKVNNNMPIMLQNMSQGEAQDYTYFMACVNELANTHIGVDNFYRENDSAKKLKNVFDHQDWNNLIGSIFTTDERYRYLQKETLNVVLACMVGNSYGTANSAQDTLKSIFKKIPDKWISDYFSEEFFFDLLLLQDLRFDNPHNRWVNDIKNLLQERFPEQIIYKKAFLYSTTDFLNYYICTNAFIDGASSENYNGFLENR